MKSSSVHSSVQSAILKIAQAGGTLYFSPCLKTGRSLPHPAIAQDVLQDLRARTILVRQDDSHQRYASGRAMRPTSNVTTPSRAHSTMNAAARPSLSATKGRASPADFAPAAGKPDLKPNPVSRFSRLPTPPEMSSPKNRPDQMKTRKLYAIRYWARPASKQMGCKMRLVERPVALRIVRFLTRIGVAAVLAPVNVAVH
jgi:hypothetical protein